jgi:hypothetical protein
MILVLNKLLMLMLLPPLLLFNRLRHTYLLLIDTIASICSVLLHLCFYFASDVFEGSGFG